jgi:hypothetical protein
MEVSIGLNDILESAPRDEEAVGLVDWFLWPETYCTAV